MPAFLPGMSRELRLAIVRQRLSGGVSRWFSRGKKFLNFLKMRQYLSVWTGLSRWLPRLQRTPALPRRMRRRADQQRRIPKLFEHSCKRAGTETKFMKVLNFLGNLSENVSGWHWMSQFLLRGLHETATFVSLFRKRGENFSSHFKKENLRQQQRQQKFQLRRRRQ